MGEDKYTFTPSRRQVLTGGASTVARTAVRGAAAEADPLIAEAEYVGRAHYFLDSGDAKVIADSIAQHPTLKNYAHHAIRAAHEAAKHDVKHGGHLRKMIIGE